MKGRWLPMKSAPKDGSMILVCETGNGEQWNVLAASFCTVAGNKDWWGVVYRNGIMNWYPVACTPVCWQPYPKPEDTISLRRRKAQILRHKYARLKR